jgi:hypothetical protein
MRRSYLKYLEAEAERRRQAGNLVQLPELEGGIWIGLTTIDPMTTNHINEPPYGWYERLPAQLGTNIFRVPMYHDGAVVIWGYFITDGKGKVHHIESLAQPHTALPGDSLNVYLHMGEREGNSIPMSLGDLHG